MTSLICHKSRPYGNFIPILPFATDILSQRDIYYYLKFIRLVITAELRKVFRRVTQRKLCENLRITLRNSAVNLYHKVHY